MNKFYVFSSELLDEPSEEDSTFQVPVYLSSVVDQRIAELERQLAAERERCAAICYEIALDRWQLYKGTGRYTGNEPGRADQFISGESSGAEMCAAAIRNGESK